MVVYISGAITGTKDYLERFCNVEQRLIDAGFEDVINPAQVMKYLPNSTSHETYMEISLALLKTADLMVLMDGWEKSEGCRQEYEYADEKGILILEYHKIKEIKLDG